MNVGDVAFEDVWDDGGQANEAKTTIIPFFLFLFSFLSRDVAFERFLCGSKNIGFVVV